MTIEDVAKFSTGLFEVIKPWIPLIAIIFGGLWAARVGAKTNLKLAERRVDIERVAAANKVQADFHLKQQENYAALTARLSTVNMSGLVAARLIKGHSGSKKADAESELNNAVEKFATVPLCALEASEVVGRFPATSHLNFIPVSTPVRWVLTDYQTRLLGYAKGESDWDGNIGDILNLADELRLVADFEYRCAVRIMSSQVLFTLDMLERCPELPFITKLVAEMNRIGESMGKNADPRIVE